MTEKRKPTYSLDETKRLILEEKTLDPPLGVKETTNGMCLTIFEAYQEILELRPSDFCKSMTDYHNHKVWQDVYKKKIKGISVYIKFKTFDGKFLLTSFKPDESG